MSFSSEADFILFIQHGWHDESKNFHHLANSLATEKTKVVIPNLGYLNTWLNINHLIKKVEQEVLKTLANNPTIPLRIVAHSLGGLIWLELLQLHQEWWPKIQNIVFLGSPIGGSDLSRIFDPFQILPTIARDLGKNRRNLAEKIAQQLPILVIVGDLDGGSDGTVVEGATIIKGAQFVRLSGLSHRDLRNHFLVIETIKKFWYGFHIQEEIKPVIQDNREQIIHQLLNIKGITSAHYRDFKYAQIYHTFKSGLKLYLWKNIVQVNHVFLTDQTKNCLYAGFVGWIHNRDLSHCLKTLKESDL